MNIKQIRKMFPRGSYFQSATGKLNGVKLQVTRVLEAENSLDIINEDGGVLWCNDSKTLAKLL